jgi:hypothetical protein
MAWPRVLSLKMEGKIGNFTGKSSTTMYLALPGSKLLQYSLVYFLGKALIF